MNGTQSRTVPLFLIVLRETLESAINVSVLLAFLHQSFITPHTAYSRLEGFLGLVCCLILGSVILRIFYVIGNDLWAVTEHYWEGTFSIVASSSFREKYSMFIVPFIITLREGMEAIVLVGGIGINENTSVASIVISTFTAIIIGTIIGILSYRTGDSLSLRWFKMCSTGLLYLIAAGLFSKGVWNFELQKFIDCCEGFNVKETGHGPGSYDITKSVWHVICSTAVSGPVNSATYICLAGYLGYRVAVNYALTSLLFEEQHGYLPIITIKLQKTRIKKNFLANQMIHNNVSRDSLNFTSGMMA
ncbi:iron permease FTR1 [Yamadazyma tenuis ATCC 10573]|uniref:Iron permease FTR1 n=1 Tax=Candida tenuis (strain ATCC 10573 / BCRC 21748 / CBS 615 / JCM 9827 / NBRC 10315 / NRRL Y-1498 / VKM Y-70) TaxID=590646 RepID=G3BDT3_CANTC|nr:iron permease FTR1 [Yamadazyma tenuis ATCC 10573]EGV60375.1 iron permease FTR1 [Yamadazyma tenuis ATCC 10573]